MAEHSERRAGSDPLDRELLAALVCARCTAGAVRAALDIVERDPLASAGCFRGDVLRGLMEVAAGFWGRHPLLYERYRTALRAAAAARRRLAQAERMEFWSVLDCATVRAGGSASTTAPSG